MTAVAPEQAPPQLRPTPPLRRTLGHTPALDGLRGVAVAGVLLYHLGQADDIVGLRRFTEGGFLGVSAFLTLSGFLITSLLILEFESVGHVSLGGFWARRFRRLLPASLLTLALVAVLTPLVGTQSQLRDLPGEIWATLAYVVNWRFILTGSDYAAVFQGAPSPIKHFWSLAVEEQCYFVLPFVVGLTLRWGRGRRVALGAVFTTIVGISVALMVVLGGGAYDNRVYMGTDTRAAELAIGALLAVAFAGRTQLASRAARIAVGLAGVLAFGGLLVTWATTGLQDTWLYRGGFAVHAVAVSVVILAVMQPGGLIPRVLGLPPITWIGRISYGVYLFHWPILWWVTPARLHVPAALAAVLQVTLTFFLAALSYRFVEQPIRSGRVLVSRQRFVVPILAMAAVALLAFALPEPDNSRVVALEASKEAVIPTTTLPAVPTETAPPPPVRVMIVGDSFALSVGLGMEHWATESGQLATLNTAIVGCGFGRGGLNRGIGLERPWPEECQTREGRIADQIAVFQPDVVLMTGGMWDITDRRLAGSRRWTHIGEPDYDEYLRGELRHLTEFMSQGGAKVVWTTAPKFDPQYNPENYMGRGPYDEAEDGRSDRFNQVLFEAVAPDPRARIVDLAGWMRQFPGGEFSPDLRIDGVHFTVESTDIVAREFLGPALVEIGREG